MLKIFLHERAVEERGLRRSFLFATLLPKSCTSDSKVLHLKRGHLIFHHIPLDSPPPSLAFLLYELTKLNSLSRKGADRCQSRSDDNQFQVFPLTYRWVWTWPSGIRREVKFDLINIWRTRNVEFGCDHNLKWINDEHLTCCVQLQFSVSHGCHAEGVQKENWDRLACCI